MTEVPLDDLLHAFLAVVAGGVINTAALSWLVWIAWRQGAKIDALEIHFRYLRKDLIYTMGKEWEDDDLTDYQKRRNK
jgi:hypothetical protein